MDILKMSNFKKITKSKNKNFASFNYRFNYLNFLIFTTRK